MSLKRKIIPILGAIALSTLSLTNCDKNEKDETYTKRESYFAQIPMAHSNGIGMAVGDFDKDGDLDLIVGIVGAASSGNIANLYFFEGDGKGNFKLRTYSK
jgi:hypothetical protein